MNTPPDIHFIQRFCYSLTHDLMAPARRIDGFVQLLQEDHRQGLDEQGALYLDRVLAASTQLQNMLDALLALSRLQRQTLHLGPLPLASWLRQQSQTLTDMDISLTMPYDATVLADSDRLRQCWHYLIDNVRKHGHQAGHKPCLHIDLRQDDSSVSLHLEDEGPGFSRRVNDRICLPFTQAQSDMTQAGMGMGLAMAETIARLHHGQLAVNGDGQTGCHCILTLPKHLPHNGARS